MVYATKISYIDTRALVSLPVAVLWMKLISEPIISKMGMFIYDNITDLARIVVDFFARITSNQWNYLNDLHKISLEME
jgi:hypothetical protein